MSCPALCWLVLRVVVSLFHESRSLPFACALSRVSLFSTWSCPFPPKRSWDEALSKSKDASASLVQDRETRLRKAIQELESARKELREAREGATATAAALMQEREELSVSRARTEELHKLGVDMERELTTMLKGGLLSLRWLLACVVLGRLSVMIVMRQRGLLAPFYRGLEFVADTCELRWRWGYIATDPRSEVQQNRRRSCRINHLFLPLSLLEHLYFDHAPHPGCRDVRCCVVSSFVGIVGSALGFAPHLLTLYVFVA